MRCRNVFFPAALPSPFRIAPRAESAPLIQCIRICAYVNLRDILHQPRKTPQMNSNVAEEAEKVWD